MWSLPNFSTFSDETLLTSARPRHRGRFSLFPGPWHIWVHLPKARSPIPFPLTLSPHAPPWDPASQSTPMHVRAALASSAFSATHSQFIATQSLAYTVSPSNSGLWLPQDLGSSPSYSPLVSSLKYYRCSRNLAVQEKNISTFLHVFRLIQNWQFLK